MSPEGDVMADGGTSYLVKRVEQPPNPRAFGYAWVMRLDRTVGSRSAEA